MASAGPGASCGQLKKGIDLDMALVVVLACSHAEAGEWRTGSMHRRQQTAGRGEIDFVRIRPDLVADGARMRRTPALAR